ncbi:hypothetical protein [Caballeronia sp. NCTM5]|uniref:hypothetical protein n=1 Tax=Caballeronia sp. NCTM5 TaxID=2921755 RepID=UPI0020294FD8|nr:hypothetical protein [Caballeronia sp. NCTM5]
MTPFFKAFSCAGPLPPWATSGLCEWRIFKCADTHLRAAGVDVATGEFKVTAAVECVDLACRAVHTRDERALLLTRSTPELGEELSSLGRVCERRWMTWVSQHRLTPCEDLTSALFCTPIRIKKWETPLATERTRAFLETLVEAETPIYWDLLRTAAMQLLRGFPDNEPMSDVVASKLQRRLPFPRGEDAR